MGYSHASQGVHRAGLLADIGQLQGVAHGNVGLETNRQAGRFEATSYGLGMHYDYQGFHGLSLKALALQQWVDGAAVSDRGIRAAIDGTVSNLSVEIGQKLTLSEWWSLEPQAQFILQHIETVPFDDGYATLASDPMTTLTGRVGLHLHHDGELNAHPLRTSFGLDVIHDVGIRHATRFNDWELHGLDGGFTSRVSVSGTYDIAEQVSLFGVGHLDFGLAGAKRSGIGGQIGFRGTI